MSLRQSLYGVALDDPQSLLAGGGHMETLTRSVVFIVLELRPKSFLPKILVLFTRVLQALNAIVFFSTLTFSRSISRRSNFIIEQGHGPWPLAWVYPQSNLRKVIFQSPEQVINAVVGVFTKNRKCLEKHRLLITVITKSLTSLALFRVFRLILYSCRRTEFLGSIIR